MRLSSGPESRSALAGIAAPTGLALVLRRWRLDEWLWLDEVSTGVRSMRLSLAGIWAMYLFGTESADRKKGLLGAARQFVLRQLRPGDHVATSAMSAWGYSSLSRAGWTVPHSAAGRTRHLPALEPAFSWIPAESYAAVQNDFCILRVSPGTPKNSAEAERVGESR